MTILVVRRHSRYAEDILAKLVSLEEYGIGAYLGESINNLARRTRELIEALPSGSLPELEEPSSPGNVEDETTEAGIVAGEAYQVIGSLSHYANLFNHPEVQRALDWFSGFEPGITYKDDASILPWPKEELKPDDEWLPIESAPRDGTPIMLAGGTWIGEINQPNPNEGIIIAIFKYNQWHCEACDAYASWVESPTHWMPLPEPPHSTFAKKDSTHA